LEDIPDLTRARSSPAWTHLEVAEHCGDGRWR
jgi:hypothetical protein